VLQNDVDPSGLPLSADPSSLANISAGLNVLLHADGSFTATAPGGGSYSFTYKARNSQNTASAAATVNLTFQPASNLGIKILDAKTLGEIKDYRWIIEEDRTFAIDPKCQINSTNPALRPTSCPPLPVQSLGY